MNTMNAMRRFTCAAMVLALALSAWAAGKGPGAVRKQVEMSMVLTGTVRLADDGRVLGLAIDRESEVPAVVSELIRASVPQWRFDRLGQGESGDADGTPMTLRVVARPASGQGEDAFALRIVSASFGQTRREAMPTVVSAPPPGFPAAAVSARLPATVYVVALIGKDGQVEDAFAEQVNLRAIGSERQMVAFRKRFADASVAAARRWRFAPPTQGSQVDADRWVVRTPVDFVFDLPRPVYGRWEAYVPGPRQHAPWSRLDREATAGVDAFAGSEMQWLGRGPRLLTPLSGG